MIKQRELLEVEIKVLFCDKVKAPLINPWKRHTKIFCFFRKTHWRLGFSDYDNKSAALYQMNEIMMWGSKKYACWANNELGNQQE